MAGMHYWTIKMKAVCEFYLSLCLNMNQNIITNLDILSAKVTSI